MPEPDWIRKAINKKHLHQHYISPLRLFYMELYHFNTEDFSIR